MMPILFVLAPLEAQGQLIRNEREVKTFLDVPIACKGKLVVTKETMTSFYGMECLATCEVIAPLKGEPGKSIDVIFHRGGNGPIHPAIDQIKSGEIYLITLNGKVPPYQIMTVMKGVPDVILSAYGNTPGDRLLAEAIAMTKSTSSELQIAGLQQLGIMRDRRGLDAVNAERLSEDDAVAKAAMIAKYRLKAAPDIKNLMRLFDAEILDVWYQESGIPQKDAKGKSIWNREKTRVILERGVSDFDYAQYVHEGIKHEWVRKDFQTLYTFFGVPWKVQRRQCVPELVALLDDRQIEVRYWAVVCLLHTIEDKDDLRWEQYAPLDKSEVQKWKVWWEKKGKAFMNETPPANSSTAN